MNENRNPAFGILMVDDEIPWLRGLSRTLEGPGGFNNLLQCSDSRQVMGLFEQNDIGLVLLDLTMPHISGEELLGRITEEHPDVLVVVLSGMNQLETAVACMRRGAFDYFVKTVEEDRLLDGVRRAVRMAELQRENRTLRQQFFQEDLRHPEAFAPIVTCSPAVRAVFRYLESVVPTRQPILILGESGVGKELIARAIHDLDGGSGPLVAVNVAGLDDNMFADTLFGHLRGAFTGADRDRGGMVEKAAGGTLFLDEIGDLSPASQVKLLRLLQEGEFYPLGSDQPRKSRARVVCATHHELADRVAERSFRKDLYYRLQAHQVIIPPLRERKDDLDLLLRHFLKSAAAALGKPVPTPPRELTALLGTYHFPGNVRELQAMVFDAVSLHEGGVLSMESFRRRIDRPGERAVPEGDAATNPFLALDILPGLHEAAELLVDAAMKRASGNQTLAAQLLGVSQPALSKRLKLRRRPQGKGA